VIEQNARRQRDHLALQHSTIDPNLIVWPDTLSDMGWHTIDRNPTRKNQFLHVTSRTNPGVG
jgi:hypothetical protein